MKGIVAYSRLLDAEGAAVPAINITLEAYDMAAKKWTSIVSGKSKSTGHWQTKKTINLGETHAPMLRLTENASGKVRVLATGGYLTFDSVKKTLSVDFGAIEYLGDGSYPLEAGKPARIGPRIAVGGRRIRPSEKIIIGGQPQGKKAADSPLLATMVAASGVGHTSVHTAFDSELLKFKADGAKFNLDLIRKDQLLNSKEDELKKTRKSLLKVEKELALKVESEKQLKDENNRFLAETQRKRSIKSIAAGIGAEVDAANQQLRSEKRPYRFGRIELDLRGTVSSDGQSMSLPGSVELGKVGAGASWSGLKVELHPQEDTYENSAEVKVPDVTGLTETAVRRLLQAVGLRLESISKSVKPGSDIPIGQSLSQSPKSGVEVTQGESVLVVFSAPQANLEK